MTQLIRYAGADYRTSDAVADAVLDFAMLLAGRGVVGVAEVPVQRGDGSVGRSRLMVGDGIPIATETSSDDVLDFDDHPDCVALAARLRTAVVELRRGTVLELDPGSDHRAYGLFDEL